MVNRRHAIALSTAALLGCVLQISAARADQAFQRFFPFLVDLDGWQGKKPDGIAMEMPGNTMITATREYQRGPARFMPKCSLAPRPRARWLLPRPE